MEIGKYKVDKKMLLYWLIATSVLIGLIAAYYSSTDRSSSSELDLIFDDSDFETGENVRIQAVKDSEPVENAQIRIDGEPTGETDDEGWHQFEAESDEFVISAELDGEEIERRVRQERTEQEENGEETEDETEEPNEETEEQTEGQQEIDSDRGSVSLDKNEYLIGETANINAETHEEGSYRIDVINENIEDSYEFESENNVNYEFTVEETGEIQADLYLKGSWIPFIGSDQLLSRSSATTKGDLVINIDGERVEGNSIEVNVTEDENPLEGASIFIGQEYMGDTDQNGEETIMLDRTDEAEIRAEFGERETIKNINIGESPEEDEEDDESETENLSLTTAENSYSEGEEFTVQASISGEPVEGVEISVDGESIGQTDNNGWLDHSITSEGEYTVEGVNEEGDLSDQITLTIESETSADDSIGENLDISTVTPEPLRENEEIIFLAEVDGSPQESVEITVTEDTQLTTSDNGETPEVFLEPGQYTVNGEIEDLTSETSIEVEEAQQEEIDGDLDIQGPTDLVTGSEYTYTVLLDGDEVEGATLELDNHESQWTTDENGETSLLVQNEGENVELEANYTDSSVGDSVVTSRIVEISQEISNPEINIITPEETEYEESEIGIEAQISAIETGETDYRIEINGDTYYAGELEEGENTITETQELLDGENTLEIIVTNEEGQELSESVTFSIDTSLEEPEIEYLSPTGSLETNSTDFTFEITNTGDYTINQYNIHYIEHRDNDEVGRETFTGEAEGPYSEGEINTDEIIFYQGDHSYNVEFITENGELIEYSEQTFETTERHPREFRLSVLTTQDSSGIEADVDIEDDRALFSTAEMEIEFENAENIVEENIESSTVFEYDLNPGEYEYEAELTVDGALQGQSSGTLVIE